MTSDRRTWSPKLPDGTGAVGGGSKVSFGLLLGCLVLILTVCPFFFLVCRRGLTTGVVPGGGGGVGDGGGGGGGVGVDGDSSGGSNSSDGGVSCAARSKSTPNSERSSLSGVLGRSQDATTALLDGGKADGDDGKDAKMSSSSAAVATGGAVVGGAGSAGMLPRLFA